MQEYVTRAVVLDHEPRGEQDAAVSFYTERFGKTTAKAKSIRKLTSKLAGHFQPGNLVRVRFVEARTLQAVEGLSEGRSGVPIADLHQLSRLLSDFEPDDELWELITAGEWSWPHALRLLGWDAQNARCGACSRAEAAGFSLRDQHYYCRACASKIGPDDVLWVHPATASG